MHSLKVKDVFFSHQNYLPSFCKRLLNVLTCIVVEFPGQ